MVMLTSPASLAAVNAFLAAVGIVQVTRIGLWHQSQKNAPSMVDEVKEETKEAVAEVKNAAKS